MTLLASECRLITDQIESLIELNETDSDIYRLWCEELTQFDCTHAHALLTGDNRNEAYPSSKGYKSTNAGAE
jgi:hypothetical protein